MYTIEATFENYASHQESAGGWGQFGDVTISFDPSLDAGSRVANAAVVDSNGEILATLVENGTVVDDGDQTFRTVTLNFLANGGARGAGGDRSERGRL
ncbi:MAG: 5'-nucleotidase C-terminal domain-containing protein [Pseudomonadota bacterium]